MNSSGKMLYRFFTISLSLSCTHFCYPENKITNYQDLLKNYETALTNNNQTSAQDIVKQLSQKENEQLLKKLEWDCKNWNKKVNKISKFIFAIGALTGLAWFVAEEHKITVSEKQERILDLSIKTLCLVGGFGWTSSEIIKAKNTLFPKDIKLKKKLLKHYKKHRHKK